MDKFNEGSGRVGKNVIRWGAGNAAARARISSLTREELERAGVTRPMATPGATSTGTRCCGIPTTRQLLAGQTHAICRRTTPISALAIRNVTPPELCIRIVNESGRATSLVLEPWGDIHRIESRASIVVRMLGGDGRSVSIVVQPDQIEVWAESGGRLEVAQ